MKSPRCSAASQYAQAPLGAARRIMPRDFYRRDRVSSYQRCQRGATNRLHRIRATQSPENQRLYDARKDVALRKCRRFSARSVVE